MRYEMEMSVRLSDLTKYEDNEIFIHCSGLDCHHSGAVKVSDLVFKYGEDILLDDVPFKCPAKGCGSTKWKPIIPSEVYFRKRK